MSYAVGRAHILCKEADSAIPHLKNYVSNNNNHHKKGTACTRACKCVRSLC